MGKTDGCSETKLGCDARLQPRQRNRRRRAVHPRRAGEVHKRLIDGKRLNHRRQIAHHLADGAACLGIFRHIGLDDDRIRTSLTGLEHRHGRANAISPGHIAAGRNDAPNAAANDHRLVRKARIVAFLDGGIERVAVEMGDGKLEKFRMRDDSPGATDRAKPLRTGFGRRITIAAKAGKRADFQHLTKGYQVSGIRIIVSDAVKINIQLRPFAQNLHSTRPIRPDYEKSDGEGVICRLWKSLIIRRSQKRC